MKQIDLLKTMMLLFCVASLGLFASCTKTDSGSGSGNDSGNGSNTSLIVGKWKSTYDHRTITEWYDGVQIYFQEFETEIGKIVEYRSDGIVAGDILCSYSISGDSLTQCGLVYYIDELNATKLHLSYLHETETIVEGHTTKIQTVYDFKYDRN